jgi:hypothetical protein
MDVGQVERVHELTVPEVAAMGHQIDLGEHVPAVGPEGDVVLEQGAGLGAPVQPLREPGLGHVRLLTGRREGRLERLRAGRPDPGDLGAERDV